MAGAVRHSWSQVAAEVRTVGEEGEGEEAVEVLWKGRGLRGEWRR